MTAAAAHRSRLSAVGIDLIASAGGPGERRAQALLRRLAGDAAAPVALDALTHVPAWLRLPHAAQARLAERVALVATGPQLARSIDGRLLGDIAERVGEPVLDAVLAAPIAGDGLAPVPAGGLAELGFGLMRAALPAGMEGLIAPGGAVGAADFARACIDRAVALETHQ